MLYEITLTLRPSLYRHTFAEQYRRSTTELHYIFKPDLKSEYTLSLVCEATGENNCHFHGVIELRDLKDRARLIDRFRRFHTTFGKKSVSQLLDYPKWVSYINKDIVNTRQLFGVDPIVYDDLQVLCDEQYRRFEEPENDITK